MAIKSLFKIKNLFVIFSVIIINGCFHSNTETTGNKNDSFDNHEDKSSENNFVESQNSGNDKIEDYINKDEIIEEENNSGTNINEDDIILKTLDGSYIYKPLEINSISDSKIISSQQTDEGLIVDMYSIPFVFDDNGIIYNDYFINLLSLKDMIINISIDFKSVSQDYYSNLVIWIGDEKMNDILKFNNNRSLSCLGKSKGTYSVGEYEIEIILTAEDKKKGKISVAINGRIISEKYLYFNNSVYMVMIGKAPNTCLITNFYLKSEKIAFEKNKKGEIIFN